MFRSILVFLTLLLVGAWMAGCGDDSPTDPGGGNETGNRAPGAPTIDTGSGAPADGATDRSVLSVLHWDCSDPDGDDLTFDVYFGQSSPPASVASDQTAESYDPGSLSYSTTYFWKIVAGDPDGETTGSAVWSFTTMAQPTETITIPAAPTGPAAGGTNEDLGFTTGGSTTSDGHAVEYRFDWGDGSYSPWSANTTAMGNWAAEGTFSIKAQARCSQHNNVESDWSATHEVAISAAGETVTTPGPISGPVTGTTIDNMNYSCDAPAVSSLGHYVQYRFDWGDGSFSDWLNNAHSNHLWSAAGIYEVKAMARCRDHTSVVSDWTAALTVDISVATEIVSRPYVSQYPEFAELGVPQSFGVRGQETNLGHGIELQIDFGDGTLSDWLTTSGLPPSAAATHTYSTVGDYEVRGRARCVDHPTLMSDWRVGGTVTVFTGPEVVSTPRINSPHDEEGRTVEIGDDITIYQADAASSHGHDLEYRFDLGDGTVSPWHHSSNVTHAYGAFGDYQVKAQARCQAHPAIESAWSAEITIHVVGSITRPDISGPDQATVGIPAVYTTNGSTNSAGHALEYQFYVSTSRVSPNGPQGWSSSTELNHAFTNAGTYYLFVQARCATHTGVISWPSTPLQVRVLNP